MLTRSYITVNVSKTNMKELEVPKSKFVFVWTFDQMTASCAKILAQGAQVNFKTLSFNAVWALTHKNK